MKGLLLVNTGSPSTKERKDVRSFVETMLMDPMVMTVPNWFRPILVKGIIGTFRQFSSAKKYNLIWDHKSNASPIRKITKELVEKLEVKLGMPVACGMRYKEPSIKQGFDALLAKEPELKEVVVLPLFPHYAQSSYGTVLAEINKVYKENNYPFKIRIIEPYFSHEAYIDALASSMKDYLKADYDKILFSFHSLPLSHVEAGWEQGKEFDYVYQIKETVKLLHLKLNLDHTKTKIVYSSAFGKDWLEPSLDGKVEELASNGVKKMIAISPGFASDNLETLYDIDIRAKDLFVKSGGEEFIYIPCLNASDIWIDAIRQIIK